MHTDTAVSYLVASLILCPLALALALLAAPGLRTRNLLVRAGALLTGAGALACAAAGGAGAYYFRGEIHGLETLFLAASLGLAGVMLRYAFKYKRPLAGALALAQAGLTLYFDLACAPGVAADNAFYADKFSLLMALVIGVLGPLICVYALGYMRDFHRHYPRLPDRRNFFFFLLFVFLSAMFGVVFSNHLGHMLFFWEVTTVCSFLLIGHTRTREAVNNAFLALNINLTGGLAFSLALIWLARNSGIVELDKMLALRGAALLPAALLCYAAITKAAQFPFSSWLLGAMVAPTPTSALLHSSTMVKAGVFLVLKMAPVIAGTAVGNAVALIGAGTFLAASIVNITEPNVKKVLAYSTVANLGLIVACGGVGGPAAVWIGLVLIVFHAVSKSLLFLVVGTVENRFYTKDMENYDNLIVKMPVTALLFVAGIAGMFIAPFGVVVSKWAAIEAFLKVPSAFGAALVIMIAYGSAATVFYWSKLLGKILSMRDQPGVEKKREATIGNDEWTAEWAHALLSFAVCAGLPLLSAWLVEPYLLAQYGAPGGLGNFNYGVITMLLFLLVALPALAWALHRRAAYRLSDTYVCGRQMDSHLLVGGAMGSWREITLKNYYLDGFFDSGAILRYSNYFLGAVVAFMLAAGVIWKN